MALDRAKPMGMDFALITVEWTRWTGMQQAAWNDQSGHAGDFCSDLCSVDPRFLQKSLSIIAHYPNILTNRKSLLHSIIYFANQ